MAYALMLDGIKLETYATEQEAYDALDNAARADTEVVEIHEDCQHKANRQRWWVVPDDVVPDLSQPGYPKVDDNGNVLYRDVLVGMCCDCGESVGEGTLRIFTHA